MEQKKEEGSIWFMIVSVIGIALLLYFEVYKKDNLYYLNYALHFSVNQNYKGVIEKKYVEKMNHNSPTIKFTNGKTMGMNGYFFGNMKEGDSISKVKGDSVIQVFRKGNRIILEIAPFYKKAIEHEKNKK